MEYLNLIITVSLVNILAIIIPWPSFVITIKNAINYSKRAWILTWLWIALWDLTHIMYCIFWIALILSKSDFLFNIVKNIWALYLIFLGIKSLISKDHLKFDDKVQKNNNKKLISFVKDWYIVTLLNPKATLFFLSIFTVMIPLDTPLEIDIILTIIMFLNAFLWFYLVSIFFTTKKVRNYFLKYQRVFNIVIWIVFILLWGKIILL